MIPLTVPVQDEPENGHPSLVDVFRLRMSDLEIPEDLSLAQSLINSISPPETTGTDKSSNKIRLTSESAFLLQTYVRTVATWMDIFDHGSTFQHRIPQLVLASPLLYHCVCAFTANHLALSNSSHDPSWEVTAVKHYGEALRLLIEALSMPSHEHALTASILLLSYEIHGAQRSEDYQRHFLGLTVLVKSRHVTAKSSGTDLANFWVYIRHEIVVAMASEKPLILDPADWEVSWLEGETREDVLGNHVLWILARVLNLIFGPDSRTEAGKEKRQNFLEEIEMWRRGLSDTFIGIPYGDRDEDGFCNVYFPVVAAAAAAFCRYAISTIAHGVLTFLGYHIVHILLYTEPVLQDESYIPLIQEQAMQITNIAISDFPPSLMIFSTHGLFYGKSSINYAVKLQKTYSKTHSSYCSREAHSRHLTESTYMEYIERCRTTHRLQYEHDGALSPVTGRTRGAELRAMHTYNTSSVPQLKTGIVGLIQNAGSSSTAKPHPCT
jgi:hypothetical protein